MLVEEISISKNRKTQNSNCKIIGFTIPYRPGSQELSSEAASERFLLLLVLCFYDEKIGGALRAGFTKSKVG